MYEQIRIHLSGQAVNLYKFLFYLSSHFHSFNLKSLLNVLKTDELSEVCGNKYTKVMCTIHRQFRGGGGTVLYCTLLENIEHFTDK